MLIALVDVISCENLECRDFAKLIPGTRGVMSYYCPICDKVSYPRTVDSTIAESPKNYKEYLQKALKSYTG